MTTAAIAPDLSAQYSWTFPGIPVEIHIHFTVIAQIRRLLTEKTPGDQAQREIGGLLMGRRRADGVEIDGLHLIEGGCDDRHFAFGLSQQAELRTAAQECGPKVLGFFRSDIRDGIRLTEQDLVIINQYFQDPSSVFLIIRTEDHGTPNAGFFFWDNGSIFADATFMQFPFDERLLPGSKAKSFVRPQPEQTAPVPQPAKIVTTQQSVRGNAKFRLNPLMFGLVVLVASVCCVVAYFVFRPKAMNTINIASPAPAGPSPLSLSASQVGKEISITWNSQAHATLGARIGVLTIKDGGSPSEIPLTKSQLQVSKFIYANRSNLVEVTLEVFPLQGTPTHDSIIVALGNSKPASALPLPASSVRSTMEGGGVMPTAEAPSRASTRLVLLPPVGSTTKDAPPVAEPPAPPQLVDRSNSGRLTVPEFLDGAVSSIPSPPPTPFRNALEPTPAAVPVQPPEIIRRVRPVIPPNILALLKRPIDVEVRVFINKDGKVVGSELLTVLPAGAAQYLGTAAVNTVRYWEFKAARKGQISVDSELVVRFVFKS